MDENCGFDSATIFFSMNRAAVTTSVMLKSQNINDHIENRVVSVGETFDFSWSNRLTHITILKML